MVDNTKMKDSDGNEYTLRAKDVSSAQDGSLRRSLIFASHYPVNYDGGGCYQAAIRSNTVSAGLTADSIIGVLRYVTAASLVAHLRKIRLSAWSMGNAFVAGQIYFDAYVARSFTADASGGIVASISSNTGKMRTSGMMPTAMTLRASDTGALTAGTWILDNSPLDTVGIGAPTTTYTTLLQRALLFERQQGEHPMILQNNEGVVIRANVPGTGSWRFSITADWDEVAAASF